MSGGESYGTDINQGYLALQYGLTERWALDFNMGYTSVGWRYFDNGNVQSTTGLMDLVLRRALPDLQRADGDEPALGAHPDLSRRRGDARHV